MATTTDSIMQLNGVDHTVIATMDFREQHACAMQLIEAIEYRSKGSAPRDFRMEKWKFCEAKYPELYAKRRSKENIMAHLQKVEAKLTALADAPKCFGDEALPVGLDRSLFALAQMQASEQARCEASLARVAAIRYAASIVAGIKRQKRTAAELMDRVEEADDSATTASKKMRIME